MLNDDFKEIEDFLKVGGNLEVQTLQKFETTVNNLVDKMFANNMKEGFVTLNTLVFHSYLEFEKSNNSIVKDFAITILVIKRVITTIQNIEDNSVLNEDDKKLYMQLIKSLMEALKEELNSHLSFFNEFMKTVNGINNLINIEE